MIVLQDLSLAKTCLLVPACWAIFVTAQTLLKAYRSPLSDIPGPWMARFTRLWLLRAISSRSWHMVNPSLHRQYGPIVRIAPNEYSIDDPDAARIIYRTKDELVKGERYSGWGLPGAEPNMFSQRDIERHRQRKKEVSGLYSNNSLYKLEKPVDRAIEALFAKLSGFANTAVVIDLFDWFHLFAFDSIGLLTFGKPFGFLQTGEDISNIMETIHNYSRYGAVVGVFAEWHPTVFKIMSKLASGEDVGMAYLIKFTGQAIAEMGQSANDQKGEENDMLSALLVKHEKNPEAFTVADIRYHVLSNVVAGSETTGISLSAAVYFLWKNPRTLAKLRQELDAECSNFHNTVSVKDVADCHYLQAVIKEALRLHPGTGLGLTRLIPKGGMTLAGRYFPEGTEVNINTYVAHANRTVFGEDADSFRPERWLEDPEKSKVMDNYFLTFGKGNRICLGKNISLMEINKLLPEVVMRFDFEFQEPEREWTVHNDWFVKQENIKVKVKTRKPKAM